MKPPIELIPEDDVVNRNERHRAKNEKDTDEYKEKMRLIEESEIVHEIHYGKRYKYQREEITKGPNSYRKELLKYKVNKGIIDKNILNIKGSKALLNDWAKERGFRNYEEYLNIVALGRGFTCYGEYEKVWTYYPEMPSPIKENRKDPRFLGIYIAENGIAKIYEGSQRMKYYNPGYDIVCPKGYKIDIKATALNAYNTFSFIINNNMIADYFVMVAFNNIIDLEPLHLWIINGDEDINGCPIRKLGRLTIPNEPKYLEIYQKYERIDKLNELKNICKIFGAKNRIETKEYNTPNKHMMLDIIAQVRLESYGEILPTDILHILEKKKKQTIADRVPIIPKEDTLSR